VPDLSDVDPVDARVASDSEDDAPQWKAYRLRERVED
jgi:hypothetical protein